MIVYSACRVFFFIYNYSSFSDISFSEFFSTLFFGLRFDLSALALLNALYLLVHLVTPYFKNNKVVVSIEKAVYIIPNAIGVLANLIDAEYFKFIAKRTTFDFFKTNGLEYELKQLIPQFLKDYWYIIILWFLFIYLLNLGYNKSLNWFSKKPAEEKAIKPIHRISYSAVSLIAWGGLFVLFFRGGIQLRPIKILNAGQYVSSKYIPLVLNSSFTIYTTTGAATLDEKKYYTDKEVTKSFPLIYKTEPYFKAPFRPNVVVIILEGFSNEYIGFLNNETSYTPFLDSLCKQSWVFANCFANSKKSIEGIPAVVAGIPTLMNTPYISTEYASNKIDALPGLMKLMGYTTSFFHGGTNGTLGFDSFGKLAGFDNYYGRKEFNNEQFYDGNWGIFDEQFLQYAADKINRTKGPQLDVIFTLSSHHPFTIPDSLKSILPKGKEPILQSIAYADLSLKKFFKEAEKKPWFKNTVFVITADHTGPIVNNAYNSMTGWFRVPLIFFGPVFKRTGINYKITQQIDIMPSILQYIGYKNPFCAFGRSLFDSKAPRFSVNYSNDTHQWFKDSLVLHYFDEKSTALYNLKNDSTCSRNLIKEYPEKAKQMEKELKVYIQQYNNSLIHNKTSALAK